MRKIATKEFDWFEITRTPLTAELARGGVITMSPETVSRRIYSALHEACHFLAATRYGLDIHRVDIIDHKGKSEIAGAFGGCGTWDCNNAETNASVSAAGAAFESFFCDLWERPAYLYDTTEAWAYLARDALTNDPYKEVDDVWEDWARISRDISDFLREYWRFVEVIAVAVLVHSDAKGVFRKVVPLAKAVTNAINRGELPGGKTSPDALAERLGEEVTQFWRGIAWQSNPKKFERIAKNTRDYHGVDDLHARLASRGAA